MGARALLAERSAGIPRNINNLCFCAMAYAWAMQRKTIDRNTMSEVLADCDPDGPVEPVEKGTEELPAPPIKDDPEAAASLSAQPAAVSLGPPPVWHWLLKFPVVCVLGISLGCLGWLGFQPKVERWLDSSARSISSSVHNYFASAPAVGQSGSEAGVASENSSENQQTGTPTDTNAMTGSQQGVADSSSSR
jgi:hypothetical protein